MFDLKQRAIYVRSYRLIGGSVLAISLVLVSVFASHQQISSFANPSPSVVALNPKDGRILWTTTLTNRARVGVLASENGRVRFSYNRRSEGWLEARGSSGGLEWTAGPLKPFPHGALASDGERFFAINQRGYLVSILDKNGRINVISRSIEFVSSSITFSKGRIIGFGVDGRLYSVDPDTGGVRWRSEQLLTANLSLTNSILAAQGPLGSTSAGPWPVADGVVVDLGLEVRFFDGENGEERYRTMLDSAGWSYITLSDNFFVIAQTSGAGKSVYRKISADNGAELWRFELNSSFRTPMVNYGLVYVAGAKGSREEVFALSQETGEIVWKSSVDACCVVADGDGHLLALDANKKRLTLLDSLTGEISWKRSLVKLVDGDQYIFGLANGNPIAFVVAPRPY